MKRGYGLVVAAGVSALLLGSGQSSFGQSERDFVNGLRPIPKVLQTGNSGLPTVGPAVRPPRDTNYQRTSAEGPAAAARIGNGERGRTRRRHADIVARSAARSAALAGCPAQSDSSGKPQVSSTRISFEFGSAVLTPEAKEVLQGLGKALNGQRSDVKVLAIEGHTDAVGTFDYNEQLSQSRAEAARDFLVHDMGVSADRLKVVGRSYCDPIDPSRPDAAANRRVVVVNQSS